MLYELNSFILLHPAQNVSAYSMEQIRRASCSTFATCHDFVTR